MVEQCDICGGHVGIFNLRNRICKSCTNVNSTEKNINSESVDISKCLHPSEKSRYLLAMLVVIPVVLVFIVATVGMGLFIIPMILFFSWFGVKIFRAYLLGSCAEITAHNFPEEKILGQTLKTEFADPAFSRFMPFRKELLNGMIELIQQEMKVLNKIILSLLT